MKHPSATRYKSRIDKWTWVLLGLMTVFTFVPLFFVDDDGLIPAIIALVVFIITVLLLTSISYTIDGEHLVVKHYFHSEKYPISEIARISPTDSILSAPAAALTGRIALRFKSPGVMKSFLPLVISPVRRDEFISALRAINPSLEVSGF